ncbi:hypothetical protein [Kocuria sp. CH-021]|uniref:hypothetical protein n=1 Tax=Kocuria sp. CH-021 TaxID=3406735 RepID=UPI003C71C84E
MTRQHPWRGLRWPRHQHRHRGERSRRARRRLRLLAAGALALVVLLVATVALLVDRGAEESPEAEAPETVSCARYGLDGVRVTARGPGGPTDGAVLDARVFGPGQERQDRFQLEFEHEGITSSYHVFAEGLDWDRPVGVVYHFHGDGAFEYESPEYTSSCLAEVAREHNMLLVVPRTPDRSGDTTWWEERDHNGQWFRALVEERIEPEYDIDRSRTWLTGYSGGAQFISQELLADHVDLVPGGGAIMMGGGQAPDWPSAEPTREQLEELRLRWDVGTEDDGTDPQARFDALSAAWDGHHWYEDQGFEHVRIRTREGVDHFGLPYARILERMLSAAEERAEAQGGS